MVLEGEGGQLTGLTAPEQQQRTFAYDAKGLLIRDEGPDGGSLKLTGEQLPGGGRRIVAEDGTGEKTTYVTRPREAGGTRRRTRAAMVGPSP